MPLSTIFNYIVAVSFIGGGNRSIRRKPQRRCNFPSFTDKLFHIMLYRIHLTKNGVLHCKVLTTVVVIGTIACKFNYHMITTMTTPIKIE